MKINTDYLYCSLIALISFLFVCLFSSNTSFLYGGGKLMEPSLILLVKDGLKGCCHIVTCLIIKGLMCFG